MKSSGLVEEIYTVWPATRHESTIVKSSRLVQAIHCLACHLSSVLINRRLVLSRTLIVLCVIKIITLVWLLRSRIIAVNAHISTQDQMIDCNYVCSLESILLHFVSNETHIST